MNQYKRVYAAVNLDAISFNIEQIKENISSDTQIIAVLKADGYGHGAVPIAHLLEQYEFIWGFAVATAEEAISLKKNHIKKTIVILDYVFCEHYKQLHF
jgi:alanine racemase